MNLNRLDYRGLAALLMLLASPALAQERPGAKAAAAERSDVQNGYNLAFVDADIRRVADAILGSMLSVDYSVDPEVTGNITLRTTQPVPKASLLPMLEAALQSVDAVIVRQGDSYRVIARKAARTRAPVAVNSGEAGSSTPGYASEIVTLKFASAKEMARLLEQFLGKDIVGPSNVALNQVVITGSSEERQAARELIARFDVDALANMNYEIYRLENVDAGTLVVELQKIFEPPYDIVGSRVRLVPLPRLRSVLVVAADRNDLAKIEPWIRRLDVGMSGKRKLYNYAVQNGRAKDIASALQQVLGGGGLGGSLSPSPPSAASTNGTGTGTQPGSGEGTSIQAGTVQQLSISSEPSTGTGGIRIVPNEQNNSLLIYADGEEYAFIREALLQLDQPAPQVLIEATLAEVTLNNDFRFGVDFAKVTGGHNITNVSNEGGVPGSIFPGFSWSYAGSSVETVLNTLQSRTNVRVLSAPKLIVLNNQTASLQVGDQVPIVTQQAQSTASPGAPIVNSVELRDTGVIMEVTPRVNESGAITLDISQEVSDVAQTTTSGINSPTIQQRRLSSTVTTRSGQMIALGGLIRDRSAKTRSGFPLLSQIPLIGGVFGTTNNTGSRTELIILLTPTIIRSPDEVRGIVDQLIDGLDAARPLVERAKERQVGGRTTPSPTPHP